jgi:hypothetical protein
MSCFLDQIKVAYVILLGFIVPIGMKWVSLIHGVAESQTFEMLTGAVGVAFVLTGLCLGVAGNSAVAGGRGGECLSLLFTRPVTRTEYVITKWLAIAITCGVITAAQNFVVALLGMSFGEEWTPSLIMGQMLERFLDAGIFSAAFMLTIFARHWLFQTSAIIAFYVWLVGQTLPPVSISQPNMPGTDQISLGATDLLLKSSLLIGDIILPTIHVYDAMNAAQFPWVSFVAYASTLLIYLTCAIAVTNKRDFFYGAN